MKAKIYNFDFPCAERRLQSAELKIFTDYCFYFLEIFRLMKKFREEERESSRKRHQGTELLDRMKMISLEIRRDLIQM